jgi:hypothetical protein
MSQSTFLARFFKRQKNQSFIDQATLWAWRLVDCGGQCRLSGAHALPGTWEASGSAYDSAKQASRKKWSASSIM